MMRRRQRPETELNRTEMFRGPRSPIVHLKQVVLRSWDRGLDSTKPLRVDAKAKFKFDPKASQGDRQHQELQRREEGRVLRAYF